MASSSIAHAADTSTAAPAEESSLTATPSGEETSTPAGDQARESESSTTDIAPEPQGASTPTGGSLAILASVDGSGGEVFGTGTFTFSVDCELEGTSVYSKLLDLKATQSETITELPLGAECSVAQTESAGADATPEPQTVTVTESPQTVEMVSTFGAVTVSGIVTLDGDATDIFLKNLEGLLPGQHDGEPYEDSYLASLSCKSPTGGNPEYAWLTFTEDDLVAGTPVTAVYEPGEENAGQPMLFRLGSKCSLSLTYGGTVSQYLPITAISEEFPEDAPVTLESSDLDSVATQQMHGVLTINSLSFTVTKKVAGAASDPDASYPMSVICLHADEDYMSDLFMRQFVDLKDGDSATIRTVDARYLPGNQECAVFEEESGAKVSFDAPNSIGHEASDGENFLLWSGLDDPSAARSWFFVATSGAEVVVTNTYADNDETPVSATQKPALPQTGQTADLSPLLAAFLVFAVAALVRRARRA